MAEAQPQIEATASEAEGDPIYSAFRSDERIHQGGLIENVIEWSVAYDEHNQDEAVGAQSTIHRLALVLSQDCDLEQDSKLRRQNPPSERLSAVLLCPAFPAEELRITEKLNSDRWKVVRQNKEERYAYLADFAKEFDSCGLGHPAILLDLTNYFTVRTSELYRQIRLQLAKPRCRLETPWREHLQSRFANCIARIGLPHDHFIPESRRESLSPPS